MAVVIPAYRPPVWLAGGVRELAAAAGIGAVIVVDDGSGAGFAEMFGEIAATATMVRHEVNRGKGAALKTGFARALHACAGCAGVVTADADGQHRVEDILRVAAELRSAPDALVLGMRRMTPDAPMRSRFGNAAARMVLRMACGLRLTDTQTGLRGIPMGRVPEFARLEAERYDFELEMLLECARMGLEIREVPVTTVYLDGNRGSHFRPVADSVRVCRAVARNAFRTAAGRRRLGESRRGSL